MTFYPELEAAIADRRRMKAQEKAQKHAGIRKDLADGMECADIAAKRNVSKDLVRAIRRGGW